MIIAKRSSSTPITATCGSTPTWLAASPMPLSASIVSKRLDEAAEIGVDLGNLVGARPERGRAQQMDVEERHSALLCGG
ncbi:MAG: hypothetical protein R2909_14105 [Gemmatimonadales bacterium]